MGEELDDEEDGEEEGDVGGGDEADGEDADAGDDEEGGTKKKRGRKLFIILPAILLLLVGGGAAAYFMGFLDPLIEMVLSEPPVQEEEGEVFEPELPPLDPLNIVFIETPEILADLKTDGSRRHYLKMKLNFELEHPEDADAMTMEMPRIIDAITVYLREMSSEDFKGSEGIHRLRQELLLRVNAAASPIRVTDVLVAEFLLQG